MYCDLDKMIKIKEKGTGNGPLKRRCVTIDWAVVAFKKITRFKETFLQQQ